MRRAGTLAAAAMFAVLTAGCAAGTAPPRPVHPRPGLDLITAQAVADELMRGRPTKGEVMRRLGEPTAVRFDSGYEVWVYRIAAATAARRRPEDAKRADARDGGGELVILVAPSGEVIKARTRIAPARPVG